MKLLIADTIECYIPPMITNNEMRLNETKTNKYTNWVTMRLQTEENSRLDSDRLKRLRLSRAVRGLGN